MMSDERRRRRSVESSRRRRKARRDERELPESTLYSYPSQSQAQSQWASSSFRQTAESPLPPITMRSNDDARASTTSMPMAVPIPSDLNRPQRRRRSRHGSGSTSDFTYSSSGSSSSSYLDISRWYPSYGRAGGVLKAFFKTPSEHKARRRRSRRQVKTKKTKAIFGFANNSSSSSVNSDMAYGMGFIKKPKSRGGEFSPDYNTAAVMTATGKEASTARPGMQRRQTDEEILEIGRKLAKVAKDQNEEDLRRMGKKPPSQFVAAMNSWERYRQSTGGQSTSGRGIAPSRSDRHHGYSSDDESEWESASEDEYSDGSSGLAYGFHHAPTPKPSATRTSRPPTVIAPAPPEGRRNLERRSSMVDPKLFGPVNSLRDFVNTPCGFSEERGTYSVAGPGQERYTGSAGTAESASAEATSLQTVYPIGTADPGRTEAARDSGSIVTIQQNNYSTAPSRDRVYSTSNDRPDPVPIQAPKPIAPVPSRLYEEQRVRDHERSDSRERRRRSSGYRGERSDSRERRQSGEYEAGRTGSRERRRNPGDSKIFAETALVGAGVAAVGAAIMANRDKGKGKEPEVNYSPNERYGHDDRRQDDTKVQDSRRAKELALEKEIERLENALAERNKAREIRRRDSKRNSAPADLDKEYERERDSRRIDRSYRPSDTDNDAQPESSKRVSEPRGQAAVVHDTDYRRADDPRQAEPTSNVDVFQYQVSDDAFQTGPTPLKAPLPVIIDVTPAPSPAPDQGRKSRRQSFEDEMRDARHIIDEASHSTAPIPEVAMAAAIAATEHPRRHEEHADEERGRMAFRADLDRVQEEANRYYHARRIAEREIRSRSRSSTPDRDGRPPRIVTPPEMKERAKIYDYSKPNADIIFDNELSPTELHSFLPKEVPVRDPSAERPRPVLNLILPTPVPTPSPEKEENRKKSISRTQEVIEEEHIRESPTVAIGPRGEIVHIVDTPEPREELPQPPTPKSVSWGPSETKQYEVESPERSRERTPESPERASRSDKKRGGGWGAIAAALAGATAGATIASAENGSRSEGSRSPPKERPILPAGTSSRVLEEEPEEPPPLPGPKPASPRSPQMPGAFADDLEFTANVAAGLENAGFPSDIVVEDPGFRRRDSPPGSNEPFAGVYIQPFTETVSDLGVLGLDEKSTSVREPGYVLGELTDTPVSEKVSAFDDPTSEHTSSVAPKLSKKEQRKLEKAARAAKLAEEEHQAARSVEGGEDEWAESSTSKKSKKSKKSKRSSISWDDEDTPINDTHVSVPIETFDNFQRTKPSNYEDDWDVPKKSKKSKRNSKGYDLADEDSPNEKELHRDAYEALDNDAVSVVSDSRYDHRSNGHGRGDDRSVVSAPSSSDRKQDSKSEKRSSGSGFWGLLKGSNDVDADNKKESKKDNAGTLGAGAGPAGTAVVATALAGGMAAARSDAAEAPSEQEEPHVGRDVDGWAGSHSREVDVFEDPEIMPRVIKPAIDPQYGDLLPLPPSPRERGSLGFEADEDLPALPDSRPATPPGRERALPHERSGSSHKRPGLISHSRRTSTYETPLRSPSHTAIPIQFRMGQRPVSTISTASSRPAGSGSPALGRSSPTPLSPVTSSGQEFSPTYKRPPRPTSWDNSKEFKPLYLLEQAGRSTREAGDELDESPELTTRPPPRESPAPGIEPETAQYVDAPFFIDTDATRDISSGPQEITPKGTPVIEDDPPQSAEDVEVTPFETPFEAPFGVASAGSLPESSYATPVESPSQTIEKPTVSGRKGLGQSSSIFKSDPYASGKDLQESSQSREEISEEQQPKEVPDTQQKKSYFPSALSILPAATLAGVGALLGRGKHDENVTDSAEHITREGVEEQTEELPASADQISMKGARQTDLGGQSGSTEQGAAGAHKSPTDTTYSSTDDTADASVPNDHVAAASMRPEEPLLNDAFRSSDAVSHDIIGVDSESQIPAVAENSTVILPASLPQDTEIDSKTQTTPTEQEQVAEDMETIIETPADTIDWPMETVPKKKGKKQSVSDAPQVPMDAESSVVTPFGVREDVSAKKVQASQANEPLLDADSAVSSNIVETKAEPAQVMLAPDVIGLQVPDVKDFEEVSSPSHAPENTEKQDLVEDPEEFQALVENAASSTTQDEQGVTAGGRPLKVSSGRRLRSSRVMSPHGSVDEYMSSDAIQSGEDAPASPSSGRRTIGKKYKKTRSLRSSRRSSAASQGSEQDDVTVKQPVAVDISERADTVPDVEQFRDAADETFTRETEADQPTDAQAENVEQALSKEPENVEEPAAREIGASLDSFSIVTEFGAEASDAPTLPFGAQSLQDTEVIVEPPVSQRETQVDDEWITTSLKKSKKNMKKKQQRISLAETPWDTPTVETAVEEAAPDASEPTAPQESPIVTFGEHDQVRNLASEQPIGEELSQSPVEAAEMTANPLDEKKLVDENLRPQSQAETVLNAEDSAVLSHDISEPREILHPLEDELTLAKEETSEELPTVQPTVDESNFTVPEDIPVAQEPEPIPISIGEALPMVSKKSKKNKKRKGSTVLDKENQSLGTAKLVEPELADQETEVQEISRSPVKEDVPSPVSESPGDATTVKEEPQAVGTNEVHQDDKSLLVEGGKSMEPTTLVPAVEEQSELQETSETRDVPQESVLEHQSVGPDAAEDESKFVDLITDQLDIVIPSKSIEPESAGDDIAQPLVPTESTEILPTSVLKEAAAENTPKQNLEENEALLQEESSKAADEDKVLRREAETAQAEEEEAEIARLQGKKKLKTKEKQRLRELKTKSEARAAEAEAIAMASAGYKAPVEDTPDAEVSEMASKKEELTVESLPGVDIGGTLTTEAVFGSQQAEATASAMTPEDTTPITTKEVPFTSTEVPESAISTAQKPDLISDALLENASAPTLEPKAEADPEPESEVQASEDPEEIARREAEVEVIRQEESELARLKNKKKPNKKDKERMKVLRASAEVREREAEALRRQIEDQEAAAATENALESITPEVEAESSEKLAAHKSSQTVSVEDVGSAQLEKSTESTERKSALSQPEEQFPRELESSDQEQIDISAGLHPEEKVIVKAGGTSQPDIDMSPHSRPEANIPANNLESVGKVGADTYSDTQPEGKLATNMEGTTQAEVKEAALDQPSIIHTVDDSVGAPQTAAEVSIALPEYATGNVHDHSLHDHPESHISHGMAIQEAGDQPTLVLDQDEFILPNDQPDNAESLTQQNSEAKLVHDEVPQSQHQEHIVLPDYQLAEAHEVGDKSETEIVAVPDELSPSKSDEGQTLSEHVIEPHIQEAAGSLLESQTEQLTPKPNSKVIPTSEAQDEEAHIPVLEETPAVDTLYPEPEPEPVFTTKKSKKDKKKKRKGTISESSGLPSGIMIPAEASEPVPAAEGFPAEETVFQPTPDDAPLPTNREFVLSDQVDTIPSEQLEPTTLPGVSNEELPVGQNDKLTSSAQETYVPASDDQSTGISAAFEHESQPVAASEVEHEGSPKEAELTLSTKKSKKDKKRRKGTVSEPSPQASEVVTPTGIADFPQQAMPESLDKSESLALAIEPEVVPAITPYVPEQEQILAQGEQRTSLDKVEATAPVEVSEDLDNEELRDLDSGDHQVDLPAKDAPVLPMQEQAGIAAQTAEGMALRESQSLDTEQASLEQEQAELPTIALDSTATVPFTEAEPEVIDVLEDVAARVQKSPADVDSEKGSLLPSTAEPKEIQADEFYTIPIKKSKKDKKKKRASAAWSEPESGAQTPVVEDPVQHVSIVTTEANTNVSKFTGVSSDLPQDATAIDSQAPLDDWAPTTSSKKSKKDKKKNKRVSVSLWDSESGAQTPLSEEPKEIQDTSEPIIETAGQKDTDLAAQPTEALLQKPETSSFGELTGIQDVAILPIAAEESNETALEAPTTSVKSESTVKKSSSDGWGLIAAALGGGTSESREMEPPTLLAEPLKPEPGPIIAPKEDVVMDDTPVTTEGKEEEPQSETKAFDDETSAAKSMGGWSTIAAAVAGVTASAVALSADKPERDTSPQRALEDVALTSESTEKPGMERKTHHGDETLLVAGEELSLTYDDPTGTPISKSDLENKVEDGEKTLIVAGGKAAQHDTEPWSFEATRDVQTEPITKPELDTTVDGDDTVIVAGGRTFEEPSQDIQIEDNGEAVAEQANDFLDVDRPAVRPSSPVPWEDGDRMDEFATPSEQLPALNEEAESTSTPAHPEPEPAPYNFVTVKKSKKDKKKKRGSVSQSLELEPEVPTPVTETPQFEEALDQQQTSASIETLGPAESMNLDQTKPAENSLDWIPKKMSKKEKRKAKKGSLSISEPEPIVTTPDESQQHVEVVTSPPNVGESTEQPSSSRADYIAPVAEAQQGPIFSDAPKTIAEPTDVKNEHLLDTATLSTQRHEPAFQTPPEDTVIKSPVIEPVVNSSEEPESALQEDPALEETPVLVRKMSKKEKRKAKKKAATSWEDDVFEPSDEPPLVATEDPQALETPNPITQPELTRDEITGVSPPIVTEAAEIEPVEPVASAIEDEWAPLSRKKSKKDKKKGKQRATEPDSGSQTPFTEEQPASALPETFEASPTEPPVPEVAESNEKDQRQLVEAPEEATELLAAKMTVEHQNMKPSAEREQPETTTGIGIDDWEGPPKQSEPTNEGFRSPSALGAELQKIPSTAPSPDIWDNDDYFMPKEPTGSQDSPNNKPIEKVDIHPAFSRELRASPENLSKDERPLVGLGLIHRHSSIFQDDDGHTPKLLTLGADNFSVESLAVEDTGPSENVSQTSLSRAIGKEPESRKGKALLEQRMMPAPEDNVQYAVTSESEDHQPMSTDPFTPRIPIPPPSPGLDDVNKMNKKGSVAMLAERFGGTKKATGKSKKVSKYVDKRIPHDDLFDEPAMWEGSERKPVEGSRMDLDAGDFWAVSDADLNEADIEPDALTGQGATSSYGQETKNDDDNVSATHSPTSQKAGEFTPQIPEQASRAEEVPLESLVVESPILGSQASFDLSSKEEQIAIEPLDRPPDIDPGQTAELPTITTELTPDGPGKEPHGLRTPRSLSPASDRGVRLDRTVSPSIEADDYAAQQGISPVSDFRRSVSRGLPPVQEEPHEEEGGAGKHDASLSAGARTPDINRDSGFVTGSPLPPRSRQFDDFQQRDSGVHLRDYPDMSPRLSSTRGFDTDSNRISQSSLENEGAKLDDKSRRSPLAESPRRRQLSESTPVLEAQEPPVTPEPQKSRSPIRRSRKHYPDLGPEAAAASLAGGAALLSGAGSGAKGGALSPAPSLSSGASRRSISDKSEKRQPSSASQPDTSPSQRRAASNTGISRTRTPEPLNLRSESPSLLRHSGTPPLRSRRTRSGDLRSLSQLSNRSHSDISALLQASPSPVSGAVDPANAANPPGPASSSSSSDLRRPTATPATAETSHHNKNDSSNNNNNNNNNNHTPLANEGRVRSKDMADVYDGFGEGRLGSPRSPTRPHSMRRRQSMQVLELESRVEQLIAENRALSDARLQAELHSTNRATSTIAERDNEIESLKQSLDFMRKEIQRLTEVNEGLNSAIAQSAVQHEDRYRMLETQHADATRELNVFRGRHSSGSKTIEEKDAEIRDLREQLEATKEQIRDMQRQILASKPADSDFLRIKDVDYFDHRCQQLCSHVQQWVLRFSKFSDMRACRLTSELNDEKIIDRLDNAVLDGSNVDNYLNDRVRRRDIFMSLAMTMIWEFVFTRYLFGMDREQRQKLKALEKLLLEVGPPHAVRQWRAVTLTLLSRREAFKTQRDQDTEAVVQAIFQTLCMILPPPSNLEDQIQNQLRKVMREAVDLSIEMRTQRAEYMMLPPLQPEYDANGDLAEPHPFNATLMNERSGDKSVDNDDLQAQGAIVRVVLFPLVVKKGDDDGVGDDEVVVCPAQVIVARPRSSSRRSMRAPSSDAGGVSLLRGGSPSTAPNKSNVSMAEAEYLEGGI